MEARLRAAAASLVAALLGAASAAGQAGQAGQDTPPRWFEELQRRFPTVAKNAAATDVEDVALELGLDPLGEQGDDHPTRRDHEMFVQAGVGGWLDAQLQTSDDAIGPPTPSLSQYLERKESALSRVLDVLQKQIPEWGFDLQGDPNRLPELLFVARLNKILLAAALVEEHAEHHAQAAQYLEVSWVLHRSLAQRPEVVSQLVDTGVLRLLAGALRKMAEPAPDWVERLTTRLPLDRMLAAVENDALLLRAQASSRDTEVWEGAWVRMGTAVAARVKGLSACEASRVSGAEIWKQAYAELAASLTDDERTELQVLGQIAEPNRTSAIHRAGRLIVDCEMTARIVALRQDRAAARPPRWPETLLGPESNACPGSVFEYRATGGGMTLRFKGSVGEPEAPAGVLPLSFESHAPRPTPAPTPGPARPAAAPTPRPALTPRPGGA